MKEEFVRFWLLRFRKLDMTQPEQRQALVDTFINAIYLYDDKVLITFNYKEGTETVAFGEAVKAEKSSDMSARGAPDIERQIVRFGVLSLCGKAAAHFLHTVCTFARINGVSAQGLHSLLSFASTKYPLAQKCRFPYLYFKFACLSKIMRLLFPLRYPIT